jgi:hypothetical protein
MKWLVTLLTFVAFAAVPTLAQAKPTPSDSNYSEIPYLSHGVGVDEANFGGSASTSEYQYRLGAGEIPYLSHGVGVDEKSLGASVAASKSTLSPDDRAISKSTPVPTSIVVTKSDGWSVDFVNPGFGALALMIGLLAGGTVALMWGRRGRLTPA